VIISVLCIPATLATLRIVQPLKAGSVSSTARSEGELICHFDESTTFIIAVICLMVMGLDRTYHAHHFIFSFTFNFFVYSVW